LQRSGLTDQWGVKTCVRKAERLGDLIGNESINHRGTEQRFDRECKATREGTGFPHYKRDYDRCDNAARLRAGAD
jgi:hypothetical protein